ncbi:MAG: hypothetical protein K2P87_10095 [Lachnospiraceae bacterium]|nr:hypothetical protein [Lachnospiraceae bacterium]
MRKRWLAMLLCGCLVFTGCGSEGEEDKETSGENEPPRESGGLLSGNRGNDEKDDAPSATPEGGTEDDDEGDTASSGAYWQPQGSVVLGNYIGVTVNKVEAEVTDADVQSEIDYLVNQHSEPREITDRNVVESGDYVCVDYTLMVGGEEVDAVQEEYLTVGSGYYDFEEQLVGLYLSESKTIECEIADYVYGEYEGQTGTYIVQIKSINELIVPEVTDAFIAENTDFSTLEEYRQDIYNTLLKDAEAQAVNDQRVAAFEKIMADSTFSGLSDADVQSYVDEVTENYEQYASSWGMDFDTFISIFMGATKDEFTALAKEDGEYTVKQYLILDAVIQDANITLTDEEYTTALTAFAAENDFDSPQAVEEYYYKEDLVQQFRRDKAYDMIVDSIVVQ